MKKLIIWAASVLFLAASFLISNSLTSDAEPAAVPAFSESAVYRVKEYSEKIGIFTDGKNEPEQIINVFVFTLPERDRELLSNGFDVTEESLMSVIEDYSA